MDAAETLRRLLAEAHERLRLGEPMEAERSAKAVRALIGAERDVAEYAAELATNRPDDDEEFLQTEFMGRLRRLAAAVDEGLPVEVLDQIAAGRIG